MVGRTRIGRHINALVFIRDIIFLRNFLGNYPELELPSKRVTHHSELIFKINLHVNASKQLFRFYFYGISNVTSQWGRRGG